MQEVFYKNWNLMEIKSSELARKIGVTRATVSNWVRRDKKLVFNTAGRIDTEDEKNKSFLFKKAPFLYGNEVIETPGAQHSAESNDSAPDNDNADTDTSIENLLKNVNIDELGETEAKEYLKIIAVSEPRKLLYTAQYKKASIEANLKKLELQEKLNLSYSRDVVHGHFITLLKIYYDNRRQVSYNSVDDIMKSVLKNGEAARGSIVALLDGKFLNEIKDAQEKLLHLMTKQFPAGEMPENEFFENAEEKL